MQAYPSMTAFVFGIPITPLARGNNERLGLALNDARASVDVISRAELALKITIFLFTSMASKFAKRRECAY
jgi:hypothetical protein